MMRNGIKKRAYTLTVISALKGRLAPHIIKQNTVNKIIKLNRAIKA